LNAPELSFPLSNSESSSSAEEFESGSPNSLVEVESGCVAQSTPSLLLKALKKRLFRSFRPPLSNSTWYERPEACTAVILPLSFHRRVIASCTREEELATLVREEQ
jgi:hypothetical protein